MCSAACLTGDVFGSMRCDCGKQLQTAMRQVEAEGRGIILYMRQEGRGIGLINKLKTYVLQEQGLLSEETVTAPCDALVIPMTEEPAAAIAAATTLRAAGVRAGGYLGRAESILRDDAGLLPQSAAFVRAYCARRPEELLAVERALTALAARGLRQLPGVEVFTGPGQSGVLSFRCRDLDCEEAAARLAEAGIAVRAGLHCAPMAHRSGGTLETGTVRVSFSAFNTSAEVRQFLQVCRTAFLPG